MSSFTKFRINKYYIICLIIVQLSVGCSDYYELPSSSGTTSDIVEWMDGKLSYYYLYNDEYNTIERDLTLSYSSFLSTTLTSLTTNVLDNKDGSIYSYITRTATTKSTTRATASKELNFGLAVAATSIVSGSTRARLAVFAVTPDSPLSKAGVCRGDYITKVDDVTLTTSNISAYATYLQSPTSVATYTLTLEGWSETIDVTAEYIYCTPILKTDIFEVDDKRVGYLSYLSFDDEYNTDLMTVMKYFKSEGVTDFILDLRMNGGGSVETSNQLTSAIGGALTSGQVFTYYTYNPSRGGASVMYKSGWGSNYLSISKLYCLVSESTASASELVINSLRGIDFEVVLIGERTEGKNAAMEVFTTTIGSYEYYFVPITIALTNAKGEGDYADGMEVDYQRDDWYGGYNFADFSKDEILISTALGLIADDVESSTASLTRSSDEWLTRGEILRASNVKRGNLVVNN